MTDERRLVSLREQVEAAHPEPKYKDDSRGEGWLWHGILAGREHVYEALAALPQPATEPALDVERLGEAIFRVGTGYRDRATATIPARIANSQDGAQASGEFAEAIADEYVRMRPRLAAQPSAEVEWLTDLLARASNRLDLHQYHDEDCPRPGAGSRCLCSHGRLIAEIDAALARVRPSEV